MWECGGFAKIYAYIATSAQFGSCFCSNSGKICRAHAFAQHTNTHFVGANSYVIRLLHQGNFGRRFNKAARYCNRISAGESELWRLFPDAIVHKKAQSFFYTNTTTTNSQTL